MRGGAGAHVVQLVYITIFSAAKLFEIVIKTQKLFYMTIVNLFITIYKQGQSGIIIFTEVLIWMASKIKVLLWSIKILIVHTTDQ